MEAKDIFVNGHGLSFFEEGEGETVILIHGYLESPLMWDPILSILKKQYHVIVPFLPGNGRSENLGPVNTMEGMAESIIGLMEELGIHSCHIVGHSMGGYVALALVEKFPARCNTLCLCHSIPWADSSEKRRRRERERAIILAGKKELAIKSHVYQLFSPIFVKQQPIFVNLFIKEALKLTSDSVVATLNGILERRERSQIVERLGKRLLFIAGTNDQVIPKDLLKALPDHFPAIYFHWLSEVGHMGIFEKPEETCEALQSFWKQ